MAGLVAAALAVLPPSWAFLTIATCIVVGLGAAPVVFAVHTRRVELRERAAERERPDRKTLS